MSRQQILDDPASACPQLRQFLGGYFHQDWVVDQESWEGVVDDFIAESAPPVVTDCAEELRQLIAGGLSDAELATVLRRLDSSVAPSSLQMSATEWLSAVLQRLEGGG